MNNFGFYPRRSYHHSLNDLWRYPYPLEELDDYCEFDPVATRRLALSPYSYPIRRYPRKMRFNAGNCNNFYIDNAYINIEDGYWNEMDRKWKAHLRSLWSDNTDDYLGNTTFKRYRYYPF